MAPVRLSANGKQSELRLSAASSEFRGWPFLTSHAEISEISAPCVLPSLARDDQSQLEPQTSIRDFAQSDDNKVHGLEV